MDLAKASPTSRGTPHHMAEPPQMFKGWQSDTKVPGVASDALRPAALGNKG